MLAGGTKTQLIALKLQSLSKPEPEQTDPSTPPLQEEGLTGSLEERVATRPPNA